MKERTWLYWVLLLICVATVVSGLVQLVAPAFVLGLVGGEATPTSKHFFASTITPTLPGFRGENSYCAQ